ncbi:MAG: spermidine/putrescine ABC transporter substrate-binding protein [Anaerolineales bacterium]|nr:spermidine/putrescine ABC transporter substrate-binding protein [Anaerolineales bacterium]
MFPRTQLFYILIVCIFLCGLLPACAPVATPTPAPTPLPAELILRNWEGDISQDILDAFAAEYGIPVTYLPYESQEEAVADIKAGQVYDVVVLENQLIQQAVADGLLAEIDFANVPNFKNISANFRDLSYDPGNRHSIPYSWGTTGMVVRTDLVSEPVTHWSDMWNPAYAGKVMAWPLSRYVIGMALRSLGYSLNSEHPQELELALEKLVDLKPGLILREWEPAVAAPYLVSGEVVIAMGQADDVIEGQKQNPNIAYVLPEDGGLLWGDNFTIPANSPNKAAAERLIDFLLRPEIAAQIVNETYYWLPNDAALPLVDPEIRNNPAIFPTAESVAKAEILLPLSPEGEALYEEIWQRFMEAGE